MPPRLVHALRAVPAHPLFPWAILAVGALLRVAQYRADRALWLDECLLTLKILDMSGSEQLRPLVGNQAAPLGFLLLERVAAQLLPPIESTLRLFPLLAGLASLPLFYVVAKRCVGPRALPIALGLFAISHTLVYFSSEVKPYSSDVATALLLYLAVLDSLTAPLTAVRVALLALLGAAALWLSYPAVFVLLGAAVSLTAAAWRGRDRTRLARLAVVYLAWAVSFVALYTASVHQLTTNRELFAFWSDGFVPFPPTSMSALAWFGRAAVELSDDLIQLYPPGVGLLVLLIGGASLFSARRDVFYLLGAPAAFGLLASALHKYPFAQRLFLFLAPSVVLFLAEGAEQLRDRLRPHVPAAGAVVLGLLFFYPLLYAGHHVVDPRGREEVQPVIAYLRKHQHPGDVVYLYYSSECAFRYYARFYGYREGDFVVGVSAREKWDDYARNLEGLRGHGRVWVLFSHVYNRRGVDEEKLFLYHLDRMGIRVEAFQGRGASVYLYDLRGTARL